MPPTQFLASVSNASEADIASRHGVDIIDLKDPANGVLGAVARLTMDRVVQQQYHLDPDRNQCISATIGDIPLRPQTVAAAIHSTAAAGVDIVKVGWFANSLKHDILPVLHKAAEQDVCIVVVLFAEYGIQATYLNSFAAAGVHGVMLDTCEKTSGTLRDKLSDQALHRFLDTARHHGLACGLAGSLRRTDIPPLLALEPDYLGFRGALCRDSQRTAGLDGNAVESVRLLIKSSGITRAHAS